MQVVKTETCRRKSLGDADRRRIQYPCLFPRRLKNRVAASCCKLMNDPVEGPDKREKLVGCGNVGSMGWDLVSMGTRHQFRHQHWLIHLFPQPSHDS